LGGERASGELAARLAYVANLVILLPVLVGLFREGGETMVGTFGGVVRNSDGLGLMVACLWLGV